MFAFNRYLGVWHGLFFKYAKLFSEAYFFNVKESARLRAMDRANRRTNSTV